MLLSVITINFNNASGLQRTIKSVQLQETDFSFEHIIIDGASADTSMKIAEQYHAEAANVVLKSEKDSGIYNAMNKGLAFASGTHVAFLNSGDILEHSKVLSDICFEISSNKLIDFLYGDLCFADNEGQIKRKWLAGNFAKSKLYFGWMPPHPMTTIRRAILDKNDGFNESLTIAADYDLMLRVLLKRDTVVKYLSDTVVRMELGGVSNGSLRGILRSNLEVVKSWFNNKGYVIPYWIFFTKPLGKINQMQRLKFK